jgi:hypothetical protein
VLIVNDRDSCGNKKAYFCVLIVDAYLNPYKCFVIVNDSKSKGQLEFILDLLDAKYLPQMKH